MGEFERSVIDALPVAFVVADATGRFLVFNVAAERLLGGRPSEDDRAGAASYVRVFHLDGETPMRREETPLYRSLMGETLEDERLVIKSASFPEARQLAYSAGHVRDEAGNITAAVIVLRDVTSAVEADRRVRDALRATEELSRMNRLKSDFIAHLSHELRTPLNAIIGFSALMRRGAAGALDDEQREYLGDILASGQHLLALINNVLDLAASICAVRDVVRGLASAKHVTLLVALDPAAAAVRADPDQIKQVLFNLLSNAIKFTPAYGTVTVRLTLADPAHARIDVTDTGIGIAEEDLPKLFVEYQQLVNDARASAGTGLGLAITRRIVEAHGGTIGVASKLGGGSTFSVTLPRAAG